MYTLGSLGASSTSPLQISKFCTKHLLKYPNLICLIKIQQFKKKIRFDINTLDELYFLQFQRQNM